MAVAAQGCEAHVNVVHTITGITSLPTDVQLASRVDASVVLTSEPLKLCQHMERQWALVSLLAHGGLKNDRESRLAAAIDDARAVWAREHTAPVWLIADASMPMATTRSGYFQDMGGFGVSVDTVPQALRQELRTRADAALALATTALSLTLGKGRFQKATYVGGATYVIDPNGAVTYDLTVEFFPGRVTTATGADTQLVSELAECVKRLSAPELEAVVKLYGELLTDPDDGLDAFLSSWAALEVFTRKAFAHLYSSVGTSGLPRPKDQAQADIHQRLNRIQVKNYGLKDRFNYLALCRAGDHAMQEIETFRTLYEFRNALYHEGIVPNVFPIAAIKDLLDAHLGRHLTSGGS